MEHIAALLLIIGCSEDLAECRELPAPVPIYEVVEDCENYLAASRATFDASAPRVFAECISVDPALEEEDAELVWDVLPGGKLVASVQHTHVQVASRGAIRDAEASHAN